MLRRTAKLTPAGRQLLIRRILVEGWPPATAAEMVGVSRATPTNGCGGTGPRAWRASRTDRRDRSVGRGHCRNARSAGSCWLDGDCASARTA